MEKDVLELTNEIDESSTFLKDVNPDIKNVAAIMFMLGAIALISPAMALILVGVGTVGTILFLYAEAGIHKYREYSAQKSEKSLESE